MKKLDKKHPDVRLEEWEWVMEGCPPNVPFEVRRSDYITKDKDNLAASILHRLQAAYGEFEIIRIEGNYFCKDFEFSGLPFVLCENKDAISVTALAVVTEPVKPDKLIELSKKGKEVYLVFGLQNAGALNGPVIMKFNGTDYGLEFDGGLNGVSRENYAKAIKNLGIIFPHEMNFLSDAEYLGRALMDMYDQRPKENNEPA